MARQSSFKKGGGFLNEVDATITGYEFTDAFAGVAYKPGKMKDLKGRLVDKPHSLNCALSVRVDGAEEDVTANLRVAKDFDLWEITDDGHTLTPVEDANLGGSSAFGKFIQSWEVAAGQGAESDEHGDTSFNYEPIIGSRVRLVQKDYSAADLEGIKKLGASIKRKGKDGKEYNRQNLVVESVLELAQPTAKPAAGKAATVKQVAGKKVAAPVVEEVEEVVDIKDLSGLALVEILQAAGGTIPQAKLSIKTLTTPLLKGNASREEVRTWLCDATNLEELATDGLIAYDKKKQTVTLAG